MVEGFRTSGTEVCEVALVLVELDDEREKVKLALVDMDRVDCSERRDADRCRTRLSYDFLVCEGARWGMIGTSDACGAVDVDTACPAVAK